MHDSEGAAVADQEGALPLHAVFVRPMRKPALVEAVSLLVAAHAPAVEAQDGEGTSSPSFVTHIVLCARVRVDIIVHARIKYVGKCQSCMIY